MSPAPPTNWSEVLRSDLDKLSPLASIPGRAPITRLKEGERRIVTILFLDIQGFTAMSEKLDPEDVQLIIDNCFKILTNEVEKYHGYIDKYEGDRMMALFGGREASEEDCECALRAALGMKEKFGEVNKILAGRDIRIGIRIGVNSGLVVTGRIGKGRDQDFTVMGDAVNLASRLESSAPPGEILVGDDVRKAAGDLFDYESLGKIEVKGKSEPVPVYVVKGLKPTRPERWERSPFTRRSLYVAREAEDESLRSAAREAMERRGAAAVAVSAPAGTGKSRLIHEFIRGFRAGSGRELLVFRGEAAASHQAPYELFTGPLSRLLSETGLADRVFRAGDGAQRLRPVVEYLAGHREADERLRSLEPSALRLEIHLSLRFVLERLSSLAEEEGRAPLVVYLDSLQCADHASIEAIDFLASNLGDAGPILFLWTYRPEFELKPEWRSSLPVREIELKPLPESGCARILQSVLEGEALGERDASILIRRSGGNPFFMEELIQSLIDGKSLVRERETWVLRRPIEEASLPETVQRILAGRFDKLDRAHKEILMAAAAVGENIPVAIVESVGEQMGIGREGIRERLEALEDLGFVFRMGDEGRLGPQLSFRHDLTRDVVYSMILNHNKKILHELVARGFESLHGERAEDYAPLIFHHYAAAGSAGKTVQYGFKALDEMVRQYAAKEGLEAVGILRPLLEGNPDLRERLLETEIKLYDYQGRRAEQLERVELLEAMAAASPRADLAAKAFLHRAMYCASVGDFLQARRQALSGLAKLGTDSSFPRLRMELLRTLGMTSYSIGEQTDALDHLRNGLAIAERIGDASAEGAFYNLMGLVHFKIGRSAEALDFYEKANLLMRRIGDRRGEANTLGNRGLVHWTLGDYSRALESTQASHGIFREIGFRKGQAVTLGNLGVIFQKFGEYGEALRCYERAVAIHREIHDRAGEGHDLVNIGETHRHLGEFAKAIEHFEAGRVLAQEAGSAYLLAENLNCLGVVYRKRGETDPAQLAKARDYTEQALALATANQLVPAEIKASSNLGRIFWLSGEKAKGFEYSERAMRLIESNRSGVEGSEEDAYVNHYTLLSEEGRDGEAREVLKTLVDLIRSRAERIGEGEHRRSFLENVRQNRYVMEEWRRKGG